MKNIGAALALLLTVLGPARSEAKKRSKRLAAPPAATVAATAPAEDSACHSSHKSAQQRAQAGHLVEAKELYLACAKAECGSFLHQECSARYTQLNVDIPSVIPLVTDEAGTPQVEVEVKMDGELLTPRIDGRALAVDPGLHEFSFSTDGGVFSSQKILVAQGQRNRTISASLGSIAKPARPRSAPAARPEAVTTAATEPPDPSQAKVNPARAPRAAQKPARQVVDTDADADGDAGADSDPTPARAPVAKASAGALPYVLTAVGLAGLGGYGLTTYWGRKDNDALATSCSPNCSQASVDHIRRLYLAGNVSLGVGLASLVAAYWVYAHSRSGTDETPVQAAYLFNIAPTGSGATAAFSGSF